MVKHPQSYLGYCVNGVVTYVPAANRIKDGKEEKKRKLLERNNNNKYEHDDIHQYIVVPETRRFPPKKKNTSRTADCYQMRLNPDLIENLKVTVKNSNANRSSFQEIFQIVHEMMGGPIHLAPADGTSMKRYFNHFVLCLFAQNIEQRTPIYFASLTGKHDLVKFLLFMLIIYEWNHLSPIQQRNKSLMKERKGKIPSKNGSLKSSKNAFMCLSLQEWMNELGYNNIGSFTALDLEMCSLNALTEECRKVIRSDRYTIDQIFGYCRQILKSYSYTFKAAGHVWKCYCDVKDFRACVQSPSSDMNTKRKDRTQASLVSCKIQRNKPVLNVDDILPDIKYHQKSNSDKEYDESQEHDEEAVDSRTCGYNQNDKDRVQISTSKEAANQQEADELSLAVALSLSTLKNENETQLAIERSLAPTSNERVQTEKDDDNNDFYHVNDSDEDIDSRGCWSEPDYSIVLDGNPPHSPSDDGTTTLARGDNDYDNESLQSFMVTEQWDVVSTANSCISFVHVDSLQRQGTDPVTAQASETTQRDKKSYQSVLLSNMSKEADRNHNDGTGNSTHCSKSEIPTTLAQNKPEICKRNELEEDQLKWMDDFFIMEGAKGGGPTKLKGRKNRNRLGKLV